MLDGPKRPFDRRVLVSEERSHERPPMLPGELGEDEYPKVTSFD
jgi:hypothetical protein